MTAVSVRWRAAAVRRPPPEQVQFARDVRRELPDAERGGARRTQFDGQRQPVETTAQLGDGGDVVVGWGRVQSLRALQEQPYRRVGAVGPDRQGQRRQPVHVFIDDSEAFPAGRQDHQVRRRVGDGFHDRGQLGQHRLRVVQQQQRRSAAQGRAQLIGRIRGAGHDDADSLGQGVDQTVRGDDREIHPERLAALLNQPVGHLQREPGLADTAGPDQRHHPRGCQTVQQLLQLTLPAHHHARAPRQPGSRRARARMIIACGPQDGLWGAGKVVGEDARLQLAQGLGRVQAELFDHQPAVLAVSVQRVRDPAVRVQRAHEQGDPALPQRFSRDEIPRLGHGVGRRPQVQQQLNPILQTRQPQLLQADRGHLREPLAELAIGRAPPQRQRTVYGPGRPLRVDVHQGAGSPILPFEHVGVDRLVRSGQQVAARPGVHAVSPTPQAGSQPRHHLLQRVGRGRGQIRAPQRIHQAVGRHDGPRLQQQRDQQRPGPAARDDDRTVIGLDLQRTEHPEPHHSPAPRRPRRRPHPHRAPNPDVLRRHRHDSALTGAGEMLLSSYFVPSREPIMGFRDLATGRVHHDNCRPTVQSAPWSRCCTATSSQSATRARTSTRPATNREDTAMTTHTTTGTHPGTDLHVDTWGDGTPVVLAHGSLATAAEEWEAQRPLAGKGFRFLAPDRRGYGRSPAATGEDFLRDAEDIAALMGDGAHLVGHSYGGLGVLFAAARRPEATLSLALLEPGAFALGQHLSLIHI